MKFTWVSLVYIISHKLWFHFQISLIVSYLLNLFSCFGSQICFTSLDKTTGQDYKPQSILFLIFLYGFTKFFSKVASKKCNSIICIIIPRLSSGHHVYYLYLSSKNEMWHRKQTIFCLKIYFKLIGVTRNVSLLNCQSLKRLI